MTPLDTNSILRLLRLAEAAKAAHLRGFGAHASAADEVMWSNCDPTTIAALCRANLRLVAMQQALSERGGEGIAQRVAEILADMEKRA